jgi:hypothetical protein
MKPKHPLDRGVALRCDIVYIQSGLRCMQGRILDFLKIESVCYLTTNHRVSEVPMPSEEDVTPRAGSVRVLTG